MNAILWSSARSNLGEQKGILNWAETNLDPETYKKVKKSYSQMRIGTLVLILAVVLPVIILGVVLMTEHPFMKKAREQEMPEGATKNIIATADYDGNFWWTHDSKKFEYPLSDYGLNPDEYEFRDEVYLYINDKQEIIQVNATPPNFDKIGDIELYFALCCELLFPLVVMIPWIFIARVTIGRPWMECCKMYRESGW